MKHVFKAAKITDRVYWVGAIDWITRDFHGYATQRGTTYNAYLILADKVTLIDQVKASYQDEMFARIESVIDLEKIDYLVSNHAEPDHSGCLLETIAATQPEKVFASKMGVKALEAHYGIEGIDAVADGEQLSLGDATLTFAETRMCHWPDSMVTYLHEDEILFSQDAFGMHLASYERFADELDPTVLQHEAAKYYANILLPLSRFVAKSVEKLAGSGLSLKTIAPDHGPIWRRDATKVVDQYATWAAQKRTNKAVVVFDTMWASTERMARALGEGLAAGGARTVLFALSGSHRSDVATEILDAGALLVGAPTVNNEMFPTVADCLTYLKGLKPKGLIGAAFGSFGWSGEAARNIRDVLLEMEVDLVGEPLRVTYVPDADVLQQCYDLGLAVADKLSGK
jgi:flavorubredoxin